MSGCMVVDFIEGKLKRSSAKVDVEKEAILLLPPHRSLRYQNHFSTRRSFGYLFSLSWVVRSIAVSYG